MTVSRYAVVGITCGGLLLSALASAGFAQTAEELADYSRSGPYLGVFFVWGKEAFDVNDIETRIASDLEAARRSTGECNPAQGLPCQTSVLVNRRDTPGGAFRAGYRFHSLFAAELDYQYLHEFEIERTPYAPRPGFETNPVIAAANREVDAEVTVHSIMVNGKVYPMTGLIQPYVLGGIGAVIGDADEKANNAGRDVDAVFGGRIGGGLDYYVTRNVVLNFNISYTITTKDFRADGFEADISLTHVPISAGVIYRFGDPPATAAP